LKDSVQTFVHQCTVCQQAKVEHTKLPGLLQPLPVPSQAWEVVSMDFVEGLPTSDRFNAVLVVIDKFSKYGHFISIHHPYTAIQIAKLFLDHVYKLHGLPKAIISDRDPVFTSNLWQELFRLTDTKLLMSSAYHPQTNGQTERLNQCLEGFLRCTVHSCPRQWSKWLSVAEFWYNTTYHSALGRSPFEVLYGHSPRHLGIEKLQLSSVPDLEEWMKERVIV
jgi:transposase InsO family protein